MSGLPSSDWSNTRLVALCLTGDDRAWNALLDRYKNLIYAIPMRYGAPHQDAADIFQAVCLDLFNELPRLRDAEALQGWLVRVTTNKCYHWKKKSNSQNGNGGEELLANAAGPDPLAADVIAGIEREQMLREAIGELPERCREMIELLFFETPPMPYEEVAQRLKLAKGSIGFIRGRCLSKLKKSLESKGF